MVFVDGVDEVPESNRQSVRQELKEIVQTYSKSRFVVTSRPSAVEEGWLEREGFSDAALQPMQLPDILAFVKHWHEAVGAELPDQVEKDALLPLAANVSKVIRSSGQISNLATSPLLCAMICALHRDRRKQIPSDRVDLYEACTRMLIERRDLERGIELGDYLHLTYRQKSVLLRDLAYWFLNNAWSAVSVERAEERVNKKLINMTDVPREASGTEVIRLFVDRSGMIRKPLPDQIDFTHRTFQEFLAAQEALAEGDIGVLIKNAHDDQWRETVILATGLANNRDREEMIKGLIKRGDKERNSQLYLLAMACIDASVELVEELKRLAQQRLSKLVPPRSPDEVNALASAGELAVPYLSGFVTAEPSIVSLCIRTLAKIGGSAALDAIEEYSLKAENIPAEELIRCWSAFDGSEYAQRVLSRTLAKTSDLELGSDALLSGFEFLQHLTSLKIKKNFRLRDFSQLRLLAQLTKLELPSCEYLEDLSEIDALSELTQLDLQDCKKVHDISVIANLLSLTHLKLSSCQVRDITPIARLRNLTTLVLRDCSQIADFNPLADLPNLTALDLGSCSGLSNLEPIAQLTTLETLSLNGCRKLVDLTALSGLTRLKSLTLRACDGIKDISPLTSLTGLETLDLSYADRIRNLQPLRDLSNLTTLWLQSNLESSPRRIPLDLRALIYR